MFERALNTPLSDVSPGLYSGRTYVNYQKKTVVDKFLIHDFMNLIQRYEISQEIWEKISSLTSQVAFSFVILCACCYSFQRTMCRQHVFYIQITGIGISI